MKNKKLSGLKDVNFTTTLLTVDTKGNLVIEGAEKFLNYNEDNISFISSGKSIHIKGAELVIESFSKNYMTIRGNIGKIEFSEVKNDS